ncbi:hypothetical protein KFK09_016858 [Dendrobium nobile]|uniref:Uncharacterized protein n=1 Tax=Dendrobium nobile TaxID=94219 RepID=A0A8T3AZG1_DENNO|nr:hypothetical protein KFK09_016858 [Dendrobium nobile]
MLLDLSRVLFLQHSQRSNNKKSLFSVSISLIRTSGSCFKLLAMGRLSSNLNKTVKFFLKVLLMSMEFNNPGETITDDSGLDNNQLPEISVAIGRLLPVLFKYVEHTECFDISVASMDLMLRSFLTPDNWLPILYRESSFEASYPNYTSKNLSIFSCLEFFASFYQSFPFLETFIQSSGG